MGKYIHNIYYNKIVKGSKSKNINIIRSKIIHIYNKILADKTPMEVG